MKEGFAASLAESASSKASQLFPCWSPRDPTLPTEAQRGYKLPRITQSLSWFQASGFLGLFPAPRGTKAYSVEGTDDYLQQSYPNIEVASGICVLSGDMHMEALLKSPDSDS